MATPPPENQDMYRALCSKNNIEQAFIKARKRKTTKNYVVEFEENFQENLATLRTELLLEIYQPQPLKTFILRDPKTRKKSLTYHTSWYRRTNCYRKCYFNQKQQEICKQHFQILNANTNSSFTKKEFLNFINNYTNICILPKKEREKQLSFSQFKEILRQTKRTNSRK